MAECKIDYVELPSKDGQGSRAFFERAFGWRMIDYGPTYAAFDKATSGLDGGVQSDPEAAPAAPLVILKTDDLEGALGAVQAAGGAITAPIMGFPGGRRFHFREPGGAEMAVWAES